MEAIADALPECPKTAVKCCYEDEFTCSDISLKVEGVGRLTFPVQGNCIQKLLVASTEARTSGRREIPAESVLVLRDQRRFPQVLDDIRAALGFDGDSHLEAQQGDLVIYRSGQFGDFPRDPEELTDVIGTLIIVLPFLHCGGNLLIQQGSETHTFVSENPGPDVFKCVAFLADCTSAVELVTEGYFVAMRYDLVIKSKRHAGIFVNPQLIYAVEDYFDGFKENVIENKFVCMLENNYTEHSLKWYMLRGEDQVTGNTFFAVAESLRLVPCLALVEIKYACNRVPGDQHCVSHAQCDVECVGFLKCVDSKNKLLTSSKHIQVKNTEICWKGRPFASNGTNCKGTCVRNGAAVVMWSSTSCELQFAFNHEESLDKLRAIMRSEGKEKEVIKIVKKYSKYFYGDCKTLDLLLLTEIALYVKDKDFSMCFLSLFKWDVLNCDISKSLALLETQYGTIWCICLLDKWKSKITSLNCDLNLVGSYIVQNLHLFVSQYLSFNGSSKVVETILKEQLRIIILSEYFIQSSSTEKNLDLVSAFFMSCISISCFELIDKILQYLTSNPLIYTKNFLYRLYWKLKETLSSSDCSFIEPLKLHVKSSLNLEIEKVTKQKNSWSIKTGLLDCQCALCKRVNIFLLSETQSVTEMAFSSWAQYCHLRFPANLTVKVAIQNTRRRKGPVEVTINKDGYEGYLAKLHFCLKKLE